MTASKISIDRAKKDKLFYFVANVVVYREKDGRCLILKRSENEITHPGVYALPGGKLEWKDLDINKPTKLNGDVIDFDGAVKKLLHRELFEEAGIKMKDKLYFIGDAAFVRPDEVPVVLVKFAVKYKSGDVVLEEDAFSDFAWVNKDEVKNYKCIDGLPDEIFLTFDLFQNSYI